MMIRGGRWGLGVGNPLHPIHTNAGGAHLTAGGVWQNGSSRELKTDISSLSVREAVEVLRGLDPVKFAYKAEPGEDYLGFIAEDVPELVASADGKTLSPMDIVAVAVKVLQQAQDRMDSKDAEMDELRVDKDGEIAELRAEISEIRRALAS